MSTQTVFNKTRKGQSEIQNRSGGLSMIERRLLILVDGKRTAEEIWRITKVADYEHLLAQLSAAGYIEADQSAQPAKRPFMQGASRQANMAPKTFMLTTLRSMASPMQAAKVGKEIQAAQSKDELQSLVDTWYRAISNNPANLSRVDGMRSTLLNKLI
ncbi:MAG: hypothetical protein P8Y12_04865 [Gammaproteobacteria bacterium]